MSEQGKDIGQSASGLEATDINAADWVLARRLTGEWSEADQAALDAWLESSLSNRITYLRLDAAWERACRLVALSPHDVDGAEAAPRRWPLMLLRIAAVLGAVAILGTAGFYALQPRVKTYVTAIGGHELVSFADGTKIELNTDTVLRARMTTSERIGVAGQGRSLFPG